VMKLVILLAAAGAVSCLDNGRGVTPPMGWRSWNLYGGKVTQDLMTNIMDGMVSRKRMVDGKPTSLCDVGYCDVGLDDNWQHCGSYGSDNFTYHDEAGFPVVNPARFPDMLAMTNHAHKLGLTAGWYLNNCICSDHCGSRQWSPRVSDSDTKCYDGDSAALIEFGFDSVKLDGCGAQLDLDLWAKLFNESGRSIMIENCHWGRTIPTATWCPWNLYRTSGDVRASYGSIVANLQSTVKFATANLSRPGCWAYPDMLEVGCKHGPGGASDPGLTSAETRSHFGAWAIVSSPLTLSHDVNDDTITDAIWDVITNREAIAVNQAWAGHSGSPFSQSNATVKHSWMDILHSGHLGLGTKASFAMGKRTAEAPSWQMLYKPMLLAGAKVAVLMMNHGDGPQDLTLAFSAVPELKCTSCAVRDIWAKKDLGTFKTEFVAKALGAHDSAFLVITPA